MMSRVISLPNLLFATLAVVSCSPSYKNGATLCSDKGECPSGYYCSVGACYMGTGPATGTGGTPGVGIDGGPTTGDGSVVGAGGGGIHFGGIDSGTMLTRDGGTTPGTGGTGGAAVCTPTATADQCDTCLDNHCCAELTNCHNDTACWQCTQDPTCASNDLLTTALNCLDAHCNVECADTSGTGGSGGSTGAVAKFCHNLTNNGSDVTLTAIVGTGASAVTFTASTGTCQPAVGNACVAFPSGMHVSYQLLYGSMLLDSNSFTNLDASPLYFLAEIDDTTNAPTLNGYSIPIGQSCTSYDPLASMAIAWSPAPDLRTGLLPAGPRVLRAKESRSIAAQAATEQSTNGKARVWRALAQ